MTTGCGAAPQLAAKSTATHEADSPSLKKNERERLLLRCLSLFRSCHHVSLHQHSLSPLPTFLFFDYVTPSLSYFSNSRIHYTQLITARSTLMIVCHRDTEQASLFLTHTQSSPFQLIKKINHTTAASWLKLH